MRSKLDAPGRALRLFLLQRIDQIHRRVEPLRAGHAA